MASKNKYFTMFSFIYFGDPNATVVHSKQVAQAGDSAQAKYLVGLLNQGLAVRRG